MLISAQAALKILEAEPAAALTGHSRPRFRAARQADPKDVQISRLQKENQQLGQELAKARFVVEVQSKLQALLETLSEGADTGDGPTS